jgi:hypothetical protein
MASDDVKASSAPMRPMVASRRYRKCAAECVRLARAAPTPWTRQSFFAAAKSWLILAALEENSVLTSKIGFADEFLDDSGEEPGKQIAPWQLR